MWYGKLCYELHFFVRSVPHPTLIPTPDHLSQSHADIWPLKIICSLCMTDSFDRYYTIIRQCLSGCFLGNPNTDQSDNLYRAYPYPNVSRATPVN